MMITARSINTLRKNTGILYFVGNAARFVISDTAMEASTTVQSTRLKPVTKMQYMLTGTKMQP